MICSSTTLSLKKSKLCRVLILNPWWRNKPKNCPGASCVQAQRAPVCQKKSRQIWRSSGVGGPGRAEAGARRELDQSGAIARRAGTNLFRSELFEIDEFFSDRRLSWFTDWRVLALEAKRKIFSSILMMKVSQQVLQEVRHVIGTVICKICDLQTLRGSFSSVSRPIFATRYSLESA